MRQPADLLIEARWVLPIAPRNACLPDHAVAVAGGRILAIGPAATLAARFEPREHIVRRGHVLLPGLVNAHTHAPLVLLRGVAALAPQPVLRVADTAREPRSHWMSADLVREGTQIAVAQMLRAGITCVASAGPYPEEAARVAAAARMRAAIGLPVSDRPDGRAEAPSAQLAQAERLWDEYRASPWVSLYFAPEAADVMDATLARVRTVADELEARVAMSLRPAPSDPAAAARTSRRGLARLAALGLLRPGFVALDLTHPSEDDLELAARTGIAAVACPQADLRLGLGAVSVRALIERGVPVGLGSGDPASAGALDLLAEARAAALAGAAVRDGGPALTAEQVLELATLGGATALGLATLIGSIEPGKAADLIAVDLGALSSQSGMQPAESLVYCATREHVSDVWLSGEAALVDGRLLAFDEQELAARRASWYERLTPAWARTSGAARASHGSGA